MTTALSGEQLANGIGAFAPDAVVDHDDKAVWIKPDRVVEVARGLRDRDGLQFEYLSFVTAVDYISHFEVVYRLESFARNQSALVKVRCGEGRMNPAVPSVYSVWRGAELQEREAWDLIGVRFDGHPNLKRIMLWEGFPGHPLRKDYLR